jgi:subtilisin-like proprotein convertase family protein/uncharacterized protein YvpB
MQKSHLFIIPVLLFMFFFLILVFSAEAAENIEPLSITDDINKTNTNSPMAEITESPSPTTSITPSPSPTPTVSPTPDPPSDLHFPIIIKAIEPSATPTPTVTPTSIPEDPLSRILICDNLDKDIPDNNLEGVSSIITIDDPRYINDLDVRLDINHSWIGDLVVNLTHQESGKTINLIDRPGFPEDSNACKLPNIVGILDDDISLPAENECSTSPAAISGIYLPNQNLSSFDQESLTGNWVITIADLIQYDTGNLDGWCLFASISESPIPPTPPPPVDSLPDSAILSGVTGQRQSLPLDCESRSAVDWARYFGVTVSELDFFYNLPESDNPDFGFVGDVFGQWGQIPPDPYGVHAEPVANLLRQYGLGAVAHRPLSWDQLRSEIAQGRPVIAWIVGNYDGNYEYVVNGIPEFYNPTEGFPMVVASFEHTIIITGYTPDKVYYLNGANIYQKDINQFLESWSALGNMAITAQP